MADGTLSSHPNLYDPSSKASPLIIVKTPVFQAENIAIRDVADKVEFQIGNSILTFGYEDALTISAMLRVHAKKAKNFAGDKSRSWRVLGTLDGIRT